jgi:hypothetical protein
MFGTSSICSAIAQAQLGAQLKGTIALLIALAQFHGAIACSTARSHSTRSFQRLGCDRLAYDEIIPMNRDIIRTFYGQSGKGIRLLKHLLINALSRLHEHAYSSIRTESGHYHDNWRAHTHF